MKKVLCLILSILMLSSLLVSCDDISEIIGTTPEGENQTAEADDRVINEVGGDPYRLEYTSNGDGTCYVSNIIYNIKYEGQFKLEIPEKSPEGETVIGIDMSATYSDANSATICLGFPCVMTKAIFDRIYARICQSKSEFYQRKFNTYFFCKDSSIGTEFVKLSMITEYPVIRFANVYVFEPTASENEIEWVRSCLNEIGYTADEYYADMQEMKQALANAVYTEEEYNALVKDYSNLKYSTYLSNVQKAQADVDRYISNAYNVSEIVLPATLKEIGDFSFSGCDGVTQIQIPEGVTKIGNKAFYCCGSLTNIEFPASLTFIGDDLFCVDTNSGTRYMKYNGTVAQFTAIAQSDYWKYCTEEQGALTVHCSDGDCTQELKSEEE